MSLELLKSLEEARDLLNFRGVNIESPSGSKSLNSFLSSGQFLRGEPEDTVTLLSPSSDSIEIHPIFGLQEVIKDDSCEILVPFDSFEIQGETDKSLKILELIADSKEIKGIPEIELLFDSDRKILTVQKAKKEGI